jgi:hypothetical protein
MGAVAMRIASTTPPTRNNHQSSVCIILHLRLSASALPYDILAMAQGEAIPAFPPNKPF